MPTLEDGREFIIGENCMAGDVLGIDMRYGVLRRWHDGDQRLGTADRAYAKGERITWPPRTDSSSRPPA